MLNTNITEADLSPDQKEVFTKILKWVSDPKDMLLTFGGVAGSGKSTVISLLAKKISKNVAFACYTGKAANVLKNKLDQAKVEYSYCGTLHGLIYTPIVDQKTLRVSGWRKRAFIDEDLIIIDEASMVSEKIFNDLQIYHKKILAVGDFAQLPPIKCDFNLMDNPQLTLKQIHRQAADNPIIKLSAMVRQAQDFSQFSCDDDRVRFLNKSSNDLDEFVSNMFANPQDRLDSTILCYFNKSRVRYNGVCRKIIGHTDDIPMKDDVVICLKNEEINGAYVFNGMRGMVNYCSNYDKSRYDTLIQFPYDNMNVSELINKQQFNMEKTISSPFDIKLKSWEKVGMLFDYGYALTVHKSQGSQFNNVVVFIEVNKHNTDDMFRRWLYTAVTRSSDKLVLVT